MLGRVEDFQSATLSNLQSTADLRALQKPRVSVGKEAQKEDQQVEAILASSYASMPSFHFPSSVAITMTPNNIQSVSCSSESGLCNPLPNLCLLGIHSAGSQELQYGGVTKYAMGN